MSRSNRAVRLWGHLSLPLSPAHAPTPRHAGATSALPNLAASCVSRSWRAAVDACPDLWQHCNLASRRCRPTDAALAVAAPRWRQLSVLSLAGVAGVTDAGLQVGGLRVGRCRAAGVHARNLALRPTASRCRPSPPTAPSCPC